MSNEETTPIKVFISYAHQDDRLKAALEKQLSFLKRQGFISAWNDRDIQAGQEWKHEIDRHLNTAQFILLLISPDFMASDYCYSVEMIEALKKHEAGEARVIPIILRPTDWEGAPFSKLQVLPTKAKPVSTWRNRDEAFLNVVQGFRRAVQEFRTQPDHPVFSETYKVDRGEAPDPGQFYGREKELSALQQWIVDERCRMVAVVGIGGIGKSSLVAILKEQVKESFDYIFWRSLQNAPPLNKILKESILFFSDQRRIELPENEDEQVLLLIQYLRDHRCLLVLDNLESVLQGGSYTGQFREGYEGYGKLLQQVGQIRHQSCLLLTSREKPKEVAELEGAAGSVHSLPLAGLISVEGQEILKNKGLSGVDETLADLVDRYSGNPLALKVVAEPIKELFQGDIARFLQEDRAVVSNIYALLDKQFHRLSKAEQGIMYWLAIEREPVTLDTLREDVVDLSSKKEVLAVLQSLRRRSMIEANGIASFALQPVIMEYVTESLVERLCQELATSTIGVFGSHAVMKAQTKDYIRESQVRLILMPIAQGLLSDLGEEGLAQKCKRILYKLRAEQPKHSSYGAGNVLNLLIQLKYDLYGYDFSHLVVLQAYLQGASLQKVNFAYAHFAKSVFTDTFGGILCVKFSPSGKLLIVGTDNKEVRLYTAAGTLLNVYRGHTDWIRSVAFSPDETTIASTSEDESIRLWDISSGECLNILQGHTSTVYSVAFSPGGSTLATSSEDKTIKLWDVFTGGCLRTFQGHKEFVWTTIFSPDGTLLAGCDEDGIILLWDVSSGQCLKTLQGHTKGVNSVAFSPDGTLLASSGDDQTIRLWDVSSGQCLKTFLGHTDLIWSVTFSPDGTLLASSGEDQTIRLWDVSSGQCLKALQGHTNTVWSVDFSPDGATIVSGSTDQTVRLWSSSSGSCLKIYQGYTNSVYSVAFSPNGSTIASGNEDHRVRLWNVHTGQCLRTLQGHTDRVWAVAFSPDGTTVASGSISIRLWNVNSGKCFKIFPDSLTISPDFTWIYSIVFSPDGKAIASGDDNRTVRLWDINKSQFKTLPEHKNLVRSVVFNSDGTLLASSDGTLNLWDMKSTQFKTIWEGTDHIFTSAFSPNEAIIACGDGQTICLWDVSSGQCLKTLLGHTDTIWSIAFSPDGTTLASAGGDQTICLWDVSSGQCLKTLLGHTDTIWSIAFSPDGTTLASAGGDGMIKFWDIPTGQCLQTIRNERPYERMDISETKGLTEAQKASLRALGAIEKDSEEFA